MRYSKNTGLLYSIYKNWKWIKDSNLKKLQLLENVGECFYDFGVEKIYLT